jgi:hypothetical protein
MGKTNPTYRNFVSEFEDNWQMYRRSLRREKQDAFDEVLEMVHNHSQAGHNQNPVEPKWAHMMSMFVGQQVRIQELEARIEELEE